SSRSMRHLITNRNGFGGNYRVDQLTISAERIHSYRQLRLALDSDAGHLITNCNGFGGNYRVNQLSISVEQIVTVEQIASSNALASGGLMLTVGYIKAAVTGCNHSVVFVCIGW
uniref:CCHC-type domain-containing protein n=1 Tax=Parascaris univalens TaxID=6257 RepID=A0A915A9Z5_PARUN